MTRSLSLRTLHVSKSVSFLCSFSIIGKYKVGYIILLAMRTSSNLNDLMISLAGRTEGKLGLTTTVKEQVDDIEVLMSEGR
jgi:hypothetical protein